MPVRPQKITSSIVFLFLACGLLIGCKSSEDRAADAFDQAIQLMKDGDDARVGVAFSNVFKYAPSNTEAREIFAGFLRSSGDSSQAAGQYLRLLEQIPDHLPALVAMTELAMESYRWDVALAYLARAQKRDPTDPDVMALSQIMDYVLAVGTGDVFARDAAITAMAAQDTQLLPRSRALADGWLRRRAPETALATIDAALPLWPDDRALHDQRLLALQALERPEAVAAQFRAMIDLFPESRDITTRYIDWLARANQLDMAEDFLRQRASAAQANAASDGVARTLDLIEFLATRKGPEAVLADLDVLVKGDMDPLLFRAMRTIVVFQTGARNPDLQKKAIADLEVIIVEAAASPVDTTQAGAIRYRIVLARMLDQIGNRAAAEAVIAPVIAERPNLADAALLQAGFLLDKGHIAAAISVLRAALGADESDPALLLLLARAYTAQGANALATRTLSLAFAASGQSPETALSFAAHLAQDGRILPAIDVLTDALSNHPRHPGLLAALGVLYIEQTDWNRAAQVVQTLRGLNGGPVADSAAAQLELTMQSARAPVDSALDGLQSQSPSDRAGTVAYLMQVQAYMAAGRAEEARQVLDQGLQSAPENTVLLAVSARLASSQGQNMQAIRTYRSLLAEDPSNEYLWISLTDAVAAGPDSAADPATGAGANTDAVLEVLDEALTALPASLRLGWARAMLLHQADRPDAAILAYEALLARAPDNLPARNNLANLLSTARQDDASLTRAADLALALAGSDVPQFRNTLGWIRFRQGDVTAAIDLLSLAAETLTDDPLAQVQAAEALIAAGQGTRARIFLTRAEALAAPGTRIAARVQDLFAESAALGSKNDG